MQRGEMGIVNGNPMGMGINMVGEWEWEWEWEWLYGNGREWESERHSRTPLLQSRTNSDIQRQNIRAYSFVAVYRMNFTTFLCVTLKLLSLSFAPSSQQILVAPLYSGTVEGRNVECGVTDATPLWCCVHGPTVQYSWALLLCQDVCASCNRTVCQQPCLIIAVEC